MIGVRVGLVVAVAALAGALAPATAPSAPGVPGALTATKIRVGDHPGFVRVVVDFRGGTLLTGEIVASDPNPFGDGVVRLPLSRRGVRTVAGAVRAHGVSAKVVPGTNRIVVRLAGTPRRFKYVGYRALHGRERLVIDSTRAGRRRPPPRCAARPTAAWRWTARSSAAAT
jgi:hypothetical protein